MKFTVYLKRIKIMGKTYSQDEINSKFRKDECLECEEGKLKYTYSSPDGGWMSYYKCGKCGAKYKFQETDMGQTLPHLESNV